MTRQEIFDKVVTGLANQDWMPSLGVGDYGGCRYRGGFGRKCPVGHLIPDELYHNSMEGQRVADNLPESKLWMALNSVGITFESVGLLSSLQAAHDRIRSSPQLDMRDGIREIGITFGLTLPDVLQSPSTDSKQA